MAGDMNDSLAQNSLLTRFAMAGAGAFPLANGDQLVIGGRSAGLATTITASGLYMDPEGAVNPFAFTVPFTNDYNYVTRKITLGEGLLLSLTVAGDATPLQRGEVYAQALIQRGSAQGSVYVGLLTQGYVSSDIWLSWPGGLNESPATGLGALKSVAGVAPAAGAEISTTVPNGARWRLQGWASALVTAATAATRQAHLQITDGTNVVMDFPAGGTQIISLTRAYYAGAYGVSSALVTADEYINIPPNLYLKQGWKIVTLTDAIAVGDQWSAPQLLVEEWLEANF